jgi:hypothetical protein
MDKKIIIGLAAGGAAVLSGIVVAAVKVVNLKKEAKKAGISVRAYLAYKKMAKKAKGKGGTAGQEGKASVDGIIKQLLKDGKDGTAA